MSKYDHHPASVVGPKVVSLHLRELRAPTWQKYAESQHVLIRFTVMVEVPICVPLKIPKNP